MLNMTQNWILKDRKLVVNQQEPVRHREVNYLDLKTAPLLYIDDLFLGYVSPSKKMLFREGKIP